MESLPVVAQVALIALVAGAGLGNVVSHLALWHLGGKLSKISAELGGKPPCHSAFGAFFWRERVPEPSFWDYIRSQCRRPGREKLRDTMRRAEVFLVIRAASVALILLCAAVLVIMHALE